MYYILYYLFVYKCFTLRACILYKLVDTFAESKFLLRYDGVYFIFPGLIWFDFYFGWCIFCLFYRLNFYRFVFSVRRKTSGTKVGGSALSTGRPALKNKWSWANCSAVWGIRNSVGPICFHLYFSYTTLQTVFTCGGQRTIRGKFGTWSGSYVTPIHR